MTYFQSKCGCLLLPMYYANYSCTILRPLLYMLFGQFPFVCPADWTLVKKLIRSIKHRFVFVSAPETSNASGSRKFAAKSITGKLWIWHWISWFYYNVSLIWCVRMAGWRSWVGRLQLPYRAASDLTTMNYVTYRPPYMYSQDIMKTSNNVLVNLECFCVLVRHGSCIGCPYRTAVTRARRAEAVRCVSHFESSTLLWAK